MKNTLPFLPRATKTLSCLVSQFSFMAHSLSYTSIFPCSHNNHFLQPSNSTGRIRCESPSANSNKSSRLEIGSPIIVVEAPKMIKTAASVPCLRANSGLVKPGDVGRIVSRKPKDVWAVRLAIGTYLLDGKYFKALEFDE